MVRQLRMLEEDLDARTTELLNVRREKVTKVIDLQAELAEKMEQVRQMKIRLTRDLIINSCVQFQERINQESVAEMTETIRSHESRIKELTERLREQSEEQTKMAENNRFAFTGDLYWR